MTKKKPTFLHDIIDYKKIFEQLELAIVIFNQEKIILCANILFTKYSGFTQKELLGKSIEQLKSLDFLNRKDVLLNLQQTGEWKGEVYETNKYKNRCFYLRIKTVYDDKQKHYWYLATLFDISRQKKSEAIINNLAYFDDLTGLPNFYYFKQLLEKEIEMSICNRQKFALFLIDIDKFKEVNDCYGHEFGDDLLKKFTERLKKNVRATDILGRRGGDEFHILLKDVRNLKYAKIFARTLITTMSEYFNIKNKRICITISIGVAFFPRNAESINDLIKKADEALYIAKDKGRNIFSIYPK